LPHRQTPEIETNNKTNNVLKALTILIALIISVTGINANASTHSDNGKPVQNKDQKLKHFVDRQVNKHIFYPEQGSEKNLEGNADVMLQVLPKGDVNIVLIQSGNPSVKRLIEKQVKKMKVDSNEVVAGQILKYRFVFKATVRQVLKKTNLNRGK